MDDKKFHLVVIDTDYNFLRTAEADIIRRFAPKVEIQIITEPKYIEEYFAEKREIDVLVIDQNSYGEYLEKHSIRHVLLMAPEIQVGRTFPDNVMVIMKYIQMDEVYRKIDEFLTEEKAALEEAAREESGEDDQPVQRNPKVIAVYSPIGGCGKSLVALALARKLKKLDQNVILVGTDTNQSISVFLPDQKPASTDLVDTLKNPGEDTYWTILQNIERGEISYLRPFDRTLPALDMNTQDWALLINMLVAKQDFDFIILDVGSVLDRETASLLAKADTLVLVTETNEIANRKLQKLLKDSELLPKCECFLIANEYRSDGMRMQGDGVFGTISPYPTWQEALKDPVFYRIALGVTE